MSGRVEELGQEARSHRNATMEARIVSGVVREDVDWRPALLDALAVCVRDDAGPQQKANAIDAAMMRAIHAGARMDAVHELGVQALDSKNPFRRLVWRVIGSRAAGARARAFNRDQAARAVEEV